MVFSSEPPHSQILGVKALKPFNAEPTAESLIRYPITPVDLVYCRNHSPVLTPDKSKHTISVKGKVRKALQISMECLRTEYPKVEVIAAMLCGGLRRQEMANAKPVNGLLWEDATLTNCVWGGARLSDVLANAGAQAGNDTHVCFSSNGSICQDDTYFGASIPLANAVDPSKEVLLAYEMNGKPLTYDHGAPVRVVISGFLGARWVKWLDLIVVSPKESQNYYQQRDYKILPPTVETVEEAKFVWGKIPAMTYMPINSVIASVEPIHEAPGDSFSPAEVHVAGYATNGGGGSVTQIELTIDEGKTWQTANITYQEGKWSWTLWEATIDVRTHEGPRVVYSRARDKEGNIQEKDCPWNLRGVGYNSWGRGTW